MSSGRIAARDAIQKAASQATHQHKTVQRGKVTAIDPTITVQLHNNSNPITHHNDFHMSQWIKFYDYVVGIQPGDLSLFHQEGSDWILFDVVSDRDVCGIYDLWNESMGVCHDAGATVRNRIDWRQG